MWFFLCYKESIAILTENARFLRRWQVEFDLKANQVGQMVMPAFIRKVWGNKYKLLPNQEAGAIYPRDTDPRKVKASLEVIIKDLENRITENEASK